MLPVGNALPFLEPMDQECYREKLSTRQVDQHHTRCTKNSRISFENLHQRQDSFGLELDGLISSLRVSAEQAQNPSPITPKKEKLSFVDRRQEPGSVNPRLHLNRNEVVGANCGLFEPVPLQEDYTSGDGSTMTKKRPIGKSSALSPYKACLQDPFSPRPLVETHSDGLAFADEATMDKFNRSVSSIETDFEDEAEHYFEVADMLSEDESMHPTKKLRHVENSPQYLSQSDRGTDDMAVPPAPPPSPEPRSAHDDFAGIADYHHSTHNRCAAEDTSYQNVEENTVRQKNPTLPMDASSVMARLDQLMFKSEATQAALQYFDKARGLPKSHCQTMVNSSRSRKQLLEGKIIKKWNGRPLVGADDDNISVASEGAGGRRRKRKALEETKRGSIPYEAPLEEDEALPFNNKPKRRMSAPPSCSSTSSEE